MSSDHILYLFEFMNKYKLFPKSRKCFVAVSGGVDSMVLLDMLIRIKTRFPQFIEQIVISHINHGTRSTNDAEQKIVEEYAQKFNLPVFVKKFNLDINLSDFENMARKIRYSSWREILAKDDLLYTAHHIDDSLEWSLMSQFKSSSIKADLGIPVINGKILRPLMCFTKKHLIDYAKKFNICHATDLSNNNLKYDRNLIREHVAQLEKRFPKIKKHYVYRSNKKAKLLNMHRLVDCPAIYSIDRHINGQISIIDKSFQNIMDQSQELIEKSIIELSNSQRGALQLQIEKLIGASKSGKWGPLTLSGGVLGYTIFNSVSLMQQKQLNQYKTFDNQLKKQLILMDKGSHIPEISLTQVQKLLIERSCLAFPYLVFAISPPLLGVKTIKRLHPLFPISMEYAQNKQIWVQTLPRLINNWQKKENKFKKFRLILY